MIAETEVLARSDSYALTQRSHLLHALAVNPRLQVYRMHELRSMGYDMADFASWVPAPEGESVMLPSEADACTLATLSPLLRSGTLDAWKAGAVQITTHRAQHSELCYGARFDIGRMPGCWCAALELL